MSASNIATASVKRRERGRVEVLVQRGEVLVGELVGIHHVLLGERDARRARRR